MRSRVQVNNSLRDRVAGARHVGTMDDVLSAERTFQPKPGRIDPLLHGLASPIGWRWSTTRTTSRSRACRPADVHGASTGRLVSPSIPSPTLRRSPPRGRASPASCGRAGSPSCGFAGAGTVALCVDPVGLARFTCLARSLQLAMSCWLVRSKRTMADVSGLVLPACLLRLFASCPGWFISMHRTGPSRDHTVRPCECPKGRALVDRRSSLRRSSRPAGRSLAPVRLQGRVCSNVGLQVLMFEG